MTVLHRLRHRINLVLAILTLATALLFSLYTLAFIYAVEDAFLGLPLEAERTNQLEGRISTGNWIAPRDPRIALHTSLDTLPEEIRVRLREEPDRVEFPGSGGSHYHLTQVQTNDGGHAWLVYDAGAQLIVKPMRNKLIALLVGTALLLLVIALGAGFWASRRTTRHLEQLASAVANLDPRQLPAFWSSGCNARDEVGLVSRALDSMAQRLRGFVDRERSFTRDASHELRTPLAVIRSAGDQIAKQPELSALSLQHANLIRESTFRLEQTVSTLLTLAREHPLDELTMLVPVLPMIEQAVMDHAPRIEGRNVSVAVDVPAHARMAAPRSVASIVVTNLIANAFAHAGEGTIRIYLDNDQLCILNPLAGNNDSVPNSHDPQQDFGFGLGIVQRLCDQFVLHFSLSLDRDRGTALATLGRIEIA